MTVTQKNTTVMTAAIEKMAVLFVMYVLQEYWTNCILEREVKTMPRKQTEAQKRLKTIQALFDAGFRTEKAISDMTLEEMLKITNLTVDDIKMIKLLRHTKLFHFYPEVSRNELQT